MVTKTTAPAAPTIDPWPPAATSYILAVEQALGGVDAEERQDLLDDLRTHIDALLEEEGDTVDLADRLGAPDDYAAELVDSAGLSTQPTRRGLLGSLHQRRQSLAASPRMVAAGQWLRQLRPAWWVARGYGLAVVASILDGGWVGKDEFPVPQVLGNSLTGLVVTAGLIYASVEVGAGRMDTSARGRGLAVRILSVVAVFGLLVQAVSGSNDFYPEPLDGGVYGELDLALSQLEGGQRALTLPGLDPVTNIYAFDTDGNPLQDVLLYDGVGNPLVLQDVTDGFGYPFDRFGLETDYRRDADGNLIPNLYPLTQYRTSQTGELAFDGAPPPPEGEQVPSVSREGRTRPVPEVFIPPLEDSESEPTTPSAGGPQAGGSGEQ
ncbi:MAG: HAAS signaling domain-containing protein [Euzebya sp.]